MYIITTALLLYNQKKKKQLIQEYLMWLSNQNTYENVFSLCVHSRVDFTQNKIKTQNITIFLLDIQNNKLNNLSFNLFKD